jgi:F0F1-type ATP synthase epsilon subunit
MIERKLTSVISTIPVDIPFDSFDTYLTNLTEQLEYYDVEMTKSEVAATPGVMQAFEHGILEIINEISWDDASEYIDIENTALNLFPEQIRIAEEAAEERYRIEQIAYAEKLRVSREELERDEAEAKAQQEAAAAEFAAEAAASKKFELAQNPNALTVIVKNRFLRKLITLFGEKA